MEGLLAVWILVSVFSLHSISAGSLSDELTHILSQYRTKTKVYKNPRISSLVTVQLDNLLKLNKLNSTRRRTICVSRKPPRDVDIKHVVFEVLKPILKKKIKIEEKKMKQEKGNPYLTISASDLVHKIMSSVIPLNKTVNVKPKTDEFNKRLVTEPQKTLKGISDIVNPKTDKFNKRLVTDPQKTLKGIKSMTAHKLTQPKARVVGSAKLKDIINKRNEEDKNNRALVRDSNGSKYTTAQNRTQIRKSRLVRSAIKDIIINKRINEKDKNSTDLVLESVNITSTTAHNITQPKSRLVRSAKLKDIIFNKRINEKDKINRDLVLETVNIKSTTAHNISQPKSRLVRSAIKNIIINKRINEKNKNSRYLVLESVNKKSTTAQNPSQIRKSRLIRSAIKDIIIDKRIDEKDKNNRDLVLETVNISTTAHNITQPKSRLVRSAKLKDIIINKRINEKDKNSRDIVLDSVSKLIKNEKFRKRFDLVNPANTQFSKRQQLLWERIRIKAAEELLLHPKPLPQRATERIYDTLKMDLEVAPTEPQEEPGLFKDFKSRIEKQYYLDLIERGQGT